MSGRRPIVIVGGRRRQLPVGDVIPVECGGTGAATAAGARTALGAQPLDATLTALAALTTAANQMIYATGADTFAMTALTPFARTLLDDADAATARATLGANSAGNLTTGTLPNARLEDTGDLTPTLVNSFTFGGNPLRYRRRGGMVMVYGQVNRASMPSGLAIFTLPEGFRPSNLVQVEGEVYGNGNLQRQVFQFAAQNSGVVQATWASADPTLGATPTGTLTFTFSMTFPVAA